MTSSTVTTPTVTTPIDASPAASPSSTPFDVWTASWKKSQVWFRAYERGGDIYFVSYVRQSTTEIVLRQSLGLIGMFIWRFFLKKKHERKIAALIASYDQTPPAELIPRDKQNFIAKPSLMTQNVIEPAGLFGGGTSSAKWNFHHAEKGKMTLYFAKASDVETLLNLLKRIPAMITDVRVQWDAAKKKYVKYESSAVLPDANKEKNVAADVMNKRAPSLVDDFKK